MQKSFVRFMEWISRAWMRKTETVEPERTYPTYCGKLTSNQLLNHARQCEMCRQDLIDRHIISPLDL